MPAWVAPAVTAAANIIGMGIAKGKDRRQLVQQGKLQDLQIAGNKEMMDYQNQKQMEMWEKTGYGAQMKQLKDAGLNPGLLYGMGGGGGQSTGNASASVTGGQAAQGSGNEVETMMGMGIQAATQLQLLKAQKENIEADTELKRENKTNVAQDTQVKIADVGKVYAEGERITQEVNALKETLQERIDQIRGDAQEAWTRGKINSETVNEQIEGKINEMLREKIQNANLDADTAKKLADVAIGWKELDLEERKTAVMELTGGEQKDQDQMINLINNIVGIIGRFIPVKVSGGKKK